MLIRSSKSAFAAMLLAIAALSACTTQPSETGSEPRPAQASSTPSRTIRTEVLEPQPLRVDLAQLPPPSQPDSASKPPSVVPVPDNPVLRVPAGFTVNVFAEGLDRPRWLALTPNGEVLVTETRQNRIMLLQHRDGAVFSRRPFATAENGLNLPLGMTFAGDSFFVGNTDAVLRFPYVNNQISGRGEKITELPGQGYNQHWTRNVVASPDGQKLYVSVGSRSNVDEEPLPRASIQVMNLDGSDRQTFAAGLRNPVGLDFNPQSGTLFATVNERDNLGDGLVPDYLTQVEAGAFYGWPYAYLSPDRLDPRHLKADGKSTRPDLAAKTRTPDVLFEAHSAALGLRFYTGNTFPEKYRNGAFVAFRGSWNRSQGTGYKIVFVPFSEGRPQGQYEDFLTGFLLDPKIPTTWGRPVGLLVLNDGSLLFTDEANNRIYRVQYTGQ
ncbi:sorbosone dehydrogenase family protein [Leptolyngbya sp. FACHB-17]|uniref:PQQ-dependent sugar dehydrogenase n=1 Tax=unclassified Leptolyngbya TaxID=2650499 RepID=UPI001F54B482|nr:sorbosone dehydrogenase family protein [Leptolyngbya sp. FACHB-17]